MTTRKCNFIYMCGILAALAGFAVPAHAQVLKGAEQAIVDSLSIPMDQLPPDAAELKLGFGTVVTSNLDAPRRERIYPLPLIFFHYKEFVALDENELRANFFAADSTLGSSGLRAGPMLKVDFGRRPLGATSVTSPGRVGTSLELGGFVSYSLGPARLRLRVRRDVLSGHKGAIAEMDIRTGLYKGQHFSFGTELQSTWGSKTYMRSYFGVTPLQSATSGLAVFTPGAGFKDVRFSVTGEYKFSQHWSSTFSLQYVHRIGEAENNPVVKSRGTAQRINSGIFVLYAF